MVSTDKELYHKDSPPLGKDQVVRVHVNLTILDIGLIDEIRQTFEVKFLISLEW